jgi:hypothetical protein
VINTFFFAILIYICTCNLQVNIITTCEMQVKFE